MGVTGPVSVWVATVTIVAGMMLSPPAAAAPQSSSIDQGVFRTLANQQKAVVVSINAGRWVEPAEVEDADAEWFARFFGRALPRGPRFRRQIGSGFLISADGEILTNDHVVADADVIDVQLLGRETTVYRATVVGRDSVSDTALIRLVNGPPTLPVATLGDSSTLESGDWVMGIGNPFQLGHSVSVGVVSHTRRILEIREDGWQALIQTDASINPGSSGGPLLNTRGEVVGITLAMLSDGVGDAMGIGFAVPINTVKAVLTQLRRGRVVRGHLGAQLRMALITNRDATVLGLPSARGALVMSVDSPSKAEDAGLRAGDVVVEFLGSPVDTAADLLARVSTAEPGSRARVVLIRNGRTCAFDIEIDTLASPHAANRRPAAEHTIDFGLTFSDAPAVVGPEGGSLVTRVEAGGLADAAGIEEGDVVRKVNARTVRTTTETVLALQRLPVGTPIFVLVWRNGAEQLIEIDAR